MNVISNIKARIAASQRGGVTIGTLVTSFTIFSHADTFISLSQKIHYVTQLWRELIAFPWLLIAGLFDFNVPKTTAGLITILIATAFVVKSSWEETNNHMNMSYRLAGIIACVFIGFTYSTLIIVPALFDSSQSSFDVTNIAIDFLAEIYYVDVDNIDSSFEINATVTAIIILSCFVLMIWPFYGEISKKNQFRLYVGVLIFILFAAIMVDRLIFSYLPISLAGGHIYETVILFVAIAAIIVGPYLSSIYLSDPATIARRNFSISITVLALIFLDRVALGIEWIILYLKAM